MRFFAAIVLSLMLTSGAFCQDKKVPTTQPAPQQEQTDDISGMYTFLRDGEFVQITVEQGNVTGFISRFGDLDSDKGAFLDQFIKKGSLTGNKLTFSCEPIHGIWYEFSGTAERGIGKLPSDEGYRILKGTLTQHVTGPDQKTAARAREVVLKSFPLDAAPESPKRD